MDSATQVCISWYYIRILSVLRGSLRGGLFELDTAVLLSSATQHMPSARVITCTRYHVRTYPTVSTLFSNIISIRKGFDLDGQLLLSLSASCCGSTQQQDGFIHENRNTQSAVLLFSLARLLLNFRGLRYRKRFFA